MSNLLKPLVLPVLLLIHVAAHAQFDGLFTPFDCREHAEFFHSEPVEEPVKIDSAAIVATQETIISFDTINGWKQWHFVENFSFGKDRGAMPMITDLDALHPYFRDQIKTLIAACKAKGIDLAVVESYRTHAKQNEYKTMGRKYTSSGAGRSKHQYGLAVDLVPIVDSVAVWDDTALWKKIGVEGEKLGLRWGGRWRTPYDPGHFEWTGGLTSIHLAKGILPPVPKCDELYPCMQEDIKLLRKYWKEWETSQSALTRN
ncbi:MAG TPA: M15 family metallopeptidase [Ohtaekwangia sp.]|uniref:M15 family metallopeptidase n=1 Tax=Ohtaekwangia sp. TaxID=2066019 RepID=UPI002F9399C7